ncbi:MAG: internal scaffolding protein [Microvirus sp.]|nr:MAG: internal scaffolding protein [Microvirus sp.]
MSKFVSGNDFFKPGADRSVVTDWGPSLCRQEFAEECDINAIMRRYETTGAVPPNMRDVMPQYIDCTALPPDFQTGMEIIAQAEIAFMRLPAKVRLEFGNDARAFVDYASDSANLETLREWGLAEPAKLPDAVRELPATTVAGSGPAAPAALHTSTP